MSDPPDKSQILSWLTRGKQIGKSLSIERAGRRFYLRAAMQKQAEGYKVVIDEIDEALILAESFEREEEKTFSTLEDAIAFLESATPLKLLDLRPSKGQKWF